MIYNWILKKFFNYFLKDFSQIQDDSIMSSKPDNLGCQLSVEIIFLFEAIIESQSPILRDLNFILKLDLEISIAF